MHDCKIQYRERRLNFYFRGFAGNWVEKNIQTIQDELILQNGELSFMVSKILFWLYLINAILLINHEIDSAFWIATKFISGKDTR